MFTIARSAGTRAAAARSWAHVPIPRTRLPFRVSLLVQQNSRAPRSATLSTTAMRFTFDDSTNKGQKNKDSVYTPPPPVTSNGDDTDETAAAKKEESTDNSSGEEELPLTSDKPAEIVSCTISPPSTEAFLKPTPIVLLTGPFGGNWCFRDTWQASLADQGYQSTSIELAMPPTPLESGDAYVRHFVKLLKKAIETDHSFFPPILIAHGFHALVAEKYVESNPVSALVLVSPYIPSIVKNRFMELAAKAQEAGESTDDDNHNNAKEDGDKDSAQDASSKSSSTETLRGAGTVATSLGLQQIKTHADLLNIPGFKSKYVMPAKAVYKVDRIAKEAEEKEKAAREEAEVIAAAAAASETASTETGLNGEEQLGHDSAPVLDKGDIMEDGTASTLSSENNAIVPPPEQTVESEASMPSPLEQLPLSIYDTIPTSNYEPLFPILLLTSQGDLIVSTSDVEQHHHLAGEVDHVELGDAGDGGHMIMVSDNAEWEEGIMGITEWLDTNGI
ncbi:hypothetical protein BGW42_000431 [Actinomortierella wolfii]|nr:hypothetical protein BGW42_000431 [Actinomortierella wolfii]